MTEIDLFEEYFPYINDLDFNIETKVPSSNKVYYYLKRINDEIDNSEIELYNLCSWDGFLSFSLLCGLIAMREKGYKHLNNIIEIAINTINNLSKILQQNMFSLEEKEMLRFDIAFCQYIVVRIRYQIKKSKIEEDLDYLKRASIYFKLYINKFGKLLNDSNLMYIFLKEIKEKGYQLNNLPIYENLGDFMIEEKKIPEFISHIWKKN